MFEIHLRIECKQPYSPLLLLWEGVCKFPSQIESWDHVSCCSSSCRY